MLHLLLVDGTLWLVHHLDPRVNVRCSWKKKSGLSPTKIFIVIIIIIIIIIWTMITSNPDLFKCFDQDDKHGPKNLLLPLKLGFILRAIPLANISPTLQHQWLPSSSVHFFLQINVFLPMTWSSSLQSWYSIWSFPVLLLLSQWWCLT